MNHNKHGRSCLVGSLVDLCRTWWVRGNIIVRVESTLPRVAALGSAILVAMGAFSITPPGVQAQDYHDSVVITIGKEFVKSNGDVCWSVSWSYTNPVADQGFSKIVGQAVFSRYRKNSPTELHSVLHTYNVPTEGNPPRPVLQESAMSPAIEDCPPPHVEMTYRVHVDFNSSIQAGPPQTENRALMPPKPIKVTGLGYDRPTGTSPDATGTLTWNKPDEPTGVLGYFVQSRFDSGDWVDLVHTGDGDDTQYTDRQWRAHTDKVSFRVQAKTVANDIPGPSNDKWSDPHVPYSGRVNDNAKLTVVAHQPVVQVMTGGFRGRHLEWSAPSSWSVLGYQIYRRDASRTNSQFALIKTAHTETFYYDTAAAAGDVYEYQVQAYSIDLGGNEPSDAVRLEFVAPPEASAAGGTETQLANFLGASEDFVIDGPGVLEPGRVHEFSLTRESGMWGYGGSLRGLGFDAGAGSWARWIDPDDIGACVDVLFCVMRQVGDDYEHRPDDSRPSRWLTFWRGTDVTTGLARSGPESLRIYVPHGISTPHTVDLGFMQTPINFPARGTPWWLIGGDPPTPLNRSLAITSDARPIALSATVVSSSQVRVEWEAPAGPYLGFRVQRRNATDVNATYEPVCCDLAPSVRRVLDRGSFANKTFRYRVGTYFEGDRVLWFANTVTVDASAGTVQVDPAPARFGFATADQDRRLTPAAGGAFDQTLPAATGGTEPLTYSLSMPDAAQLQFAPATRRLSGMPPAGTFHGTMHVHDANGDTDHLRFSVVVGSLAEAPGSLVATADDNAHQIALMWTEPTNTGSSAVTGYRIEHSPSGADGSWIALVVNTGGTALQWTHANLRGGQIAHYRVAAITDAGVGAYAVAPPATTIATDSPSAPVNLTAVVEAGRRVTLTWDPPADDGGADILGYCVQAVFRSSSNFPAAGERRTVDGAEVPQADPGVDADTGRSEHRVVVAPKLPTSARSYTFRGHLRDGLPVFYRVGAFNASNDGVILREPVVDSGDDDGDTTPELGVEIASTCNERTSNNSGGPPPPSRTTNFAAVSLTLGQAAVPGVPTSLTLSAEEVPGSIFLDWSPPEDDGGSPITGYRIAVSETGADDSFTTLVSDTQSTRTYYTHDGGWTVSTRRHYKVAAINSTGAGTFSTVQSQASVPRNWPGKPEGVEAVPGAGSITINWAPPTYSGHASQPINGYRLQTSDTGADDDWGSDIEIEVDDRTYVDAGLTVAQRRYYRLRANNGFSVSGQSWSRTVTARAIAFGAPPCTDGLDHHRNEDDLRIYARYSISVACQPAPANGRVVVEYSHDRWADDEYQQLVQIGIGPLGTEYHATSLDIGPLRRPGHKLWARAWYQSSTGERGPRVTWELVDDTADTDSPPLAPPNLVATPYHNAVHLSWDSAFQGADPIEHYHVQYRVDGGSWSGSTELTSSATQFTVTGDSGLSPATEYNFRVRATNTARGDGPWSEINATTLAASYLPNPPYNLVATAVPGADRSVRLTWDAPRTGGRMTRMRLDRTIQGAPSRFAQFEYQLPDESITNRSHTVTQQERGQTLYYRLVSVWEGFNEDNSNPEFSNDPIPDDQFDAGEHLTFVSHPSNVASITIPGLPPNMPENVTAFGGRDSILLEWRNPRGFVGSSVESFRIQHSSTAGMWQNLVSSTGDITSNRFIDRTAPEGEVRRYQIAAINADGPGDYAMEVSATRSTNRPHAPREVAAIVHGEDVEVRWGAPQSLGTGEAAVRNYRIDRSASGIGQWTTLTSVVGTSRTHYVDTTVQLGSTYYYHVFAINSNTPGLSLPVRSNGIEVVANWVRSPIELQVAVKGPRHTLTWNQVEDGGGVTINGYRLEYATTPDAEPAEWTLLAAVEPSSTTTHRHDGLRQEVAEHYYYRVASETSQGRSGYSLVVGAPVGDLIDALDLDGSTTVDTIDTQILYFALGFRDVLGDNTGRQPGFESLRQAMLERLTMRDADDDRYRELLMEARELANGVNAPDFDINGSGAVTEDDALILYFTEVLATEFASEQLGVDFRRTFLGPLAREQNPSDGDLQQLLQRANELLGN